MSLKDFVTVKNPLTSRGVIGGAAGVALGAAQALGLGLEPQEAVSVEQLLTGFLTSLAGLVAVWGRFKAQKRIAFSKG